MLTRKQHELLMFIHERIRETGVSPSFDEMKEALDLRSKSGIHRLITALVDRGFIRRLPHKARAIEIIRMPDTAVPDQKPRAKGFSPSVIEGNGGRTSDSNVTKMPVETRATEACEVPLIGRIAAGTPIEALSENGVQIGVPGDMISGGEHYALEVKGDSMINAGILDGDVVVVKRSDTATNGEIVVALIDEQEATLKRLRRKGNSVALEAANPSYETRIFGPDRVKVQGCLVGLIRNY